MMVLLIPRVKESVRNPKTKHFLPEQGELLELNSFWIRRIKDGSVYVGDTKKVKKNFFKSERKQENIKKEFIRGGNKND